MLHSHHGRGLHAISPSLAHRKTATGTIPSDRTPSKASQADGGGARGLNARRRMRAPSTQASGRHRSNRAERHNRP
jgi:hypothetical protein